MSNANSLTQAEGQQMRKLLIAASLLCAGTVHGEPLSSMGIGTATCVQFATEHRADAGIEQRFFDWAQGLMSGINDALEDSMGKYRDLNSMPIAQQKEILRACTRAQRWHPRTATSRR
jgi:hypothetical protein